jgi:hypothetical protein
VWNQLDVRGVGSGDGISAHVRTRKVRAGIPFPSDDIHLPYVSTIFASTMAGQSVSCYLRPNHLSAEELRRTIAMLGQVLLVYGLFLYFAPI